MSQKIGPQERKKGFTNLVDRKASARSRLSFLFTSLYSSTEPPPGISLTFPAFAHSSPSDWHLTKPDDLPELFKKSH